LTKSQAEAKGELVFAENTKGNSGAWAQFQAVKVNVDSSTGEVTINVQASVATMFAKISGIDQLNLKSAASAKFDSRDVEVSLQLDMTGSMCSPCSKISALKKATKSLVDILLPDNPTSQKVRVALAPFSAGVNPGPYFKAVNGKDYKPANVKRTYTTNCVYERINPANAATDAPPTNWEDSFKVKSDLPNTVQNCPSSAIVPLTNDKSVLKTAINQFSTGSSTAGQLGAAWAWYLISPAWKTIWPFVSQPTEYGDTTTDKVVILMTDRVYNTIGGFNYGDASPQAVTATNLSVDVCTSMKAQNIRVYTVGFDLPGISDPTARQRAADALKACATQAYPGDTSNFFEAEDEDALEAAFKSIANNILRLRLTN
jgi:hypothetical protein